MRDESAWRDCWRGSWLSARGNLVVGQSGGPTAVVNASLVAVIQEALRHEAIGEIYGMRFGALGLLQEDLVDLRRVSREILEDLRRTPSAALGTSRVDLGDDDVEQIMRTLQAREIRYFLYIGGNGSAATALRLHRLAADVRYDLPAIADPKTNDNGPVHTDPWPGHPSVARWLGVSVREAGLDTEAIGIADPVKVVETMGRHTGWVAASTALARQREDEAPHLLDLSLRQVPTKQLLADG